MGRYDPGLEGGGRGGRVSRNGMMLMREEEEVERGPSDVWPYRVSVENRSNLDDAPQLQVATLCLSNFLLPALVIRRGRDAEEDS